MRKRSGWRRRGWALTAGIAAFLFMILGVERCGAQPARQGGAEGTAIQVGREAPDFDLVRFECVKPEDEKTGAGERIRLSSYRGKKVVFVIFSSYT